MTAISNPIYGNVVIREWLNGALFPLSLSLAFIISVHLWDVWKENGRGWTRLPGVKVSCSFWWLFCAESVRAGIVWVLLRIQNDGQAVTETLGLAASWGFVFGATALIGAFLRTIYTLTPARWGHRYWIAAVAISVLFLILSEIFPPFPLPQR